MSKRAEGGGGGGGGGEGRGRRREGEGGTSHGENVIGYLRISHLPATGTPRYSPLADGAGYQCGFCTPSFGRTAIGDAVTPGSCRNNSSPIAIYVPAPANENNESGTNYRSDECKKAGKNVARPGTPRLTRAKYCRLSLSLSLSVSVSPFSSLILSHARIFTGGRGHYRRLAAPTVNRRGKT